MLRWLKGRSGPGTAAQAGPSEASRDLIARADACRERKENLDAVTLYEHALKLDPESLYAIYWLATVYKDLADLVPAYEWCQRGLAIDPDQIGLLLRLGSVAVAGFNPTTALECYEHVARLDPEVDDIDSMLADQYCMLGRLRESVAAFDRALVRAPDSVKLQSNRLFVLNYTNFLSQDELFKEHREWGVRHEARTRQFAPSPGSVSVVKARLRIGYVSPDMRAHPVASFLEPLLRAHDKAAFEIHCFDSSTFAEDSVTARLRSHADVWHKVHELSDLALAGLIRSAGIDILVDLSGHTSLHRLLTFALKPAPIQATWLGYLNTTGLRAMDYRITDDYLDPEGATERFHTEALFRIPNHACFSPSAESPVANPLPAGQQAVFTFGSVNQWSKVTDDVKKIWGELLRSVADCRLIVVACGGQHPGFRDRIVADFVHFGARAGQIHVSPNLPVRDFLELFHQIDVTLDPFPYGGGTTTMQSLWMGVPVVTLRGAHAFARNAIGPLSEAALGNLIAESPARYVEIASELTRNHGWLKQTRASLRQRIAGSPLMDEKRFAQKMESAFRAMWRNHCAGQKAELRVV
jgi:protein O-GlcNAc transferase